MNTKKKNKVLTFNFISKKNTDIKKFFFEQTKTKAFFKYLKKDYYESFINDKPSRDIFFVKKGDAVKLIIYEDENDAILPVDERLSVLYEDAFFIFVNKPCNIAVHPTKKHFKRHLQGIVKNYFYKMGLFSTPRVLNRLDYQTSGIVGFAKYGFVHGMFQNLKIKKAYLLKVEAFLNLPKKVKLPIKKCDDSIMRMVADDGKHACTYFKFLSKKKRILKALLLTGRTHQIRVHLNYYGLKITGDRLYGNGGEEMMLHCFYIKFRHPFTRKIISIKNNPSWR